MIWLTGQSSIFQIKFHFFPNPHPTSKVRTIKKWGYPDNSLCRKVWLIYGRGFPRGVFHCNTQQLATFQKPPPRWVPTMKSPMSEHTFLSEKRKTQEPEIEATGERKELLTKTVLFWLFRAQEKFLILSIVPLATESLRWRKWTDDDDEKIGRSIKCQAQKRRRHSWRCVSCASRKHWHEEEKLFLSIFLGSFFSFSQLFLPVCRRP